ncbi:MAG: HAD-IIB family hydrolase, partial [Oscillospiraceae bacterium]
VLHDIDDTITNDGKLLPEAYEALWKLERAGIKVIPVTGRPAGWCDMAVRQWPIDAIIGENGAFVFYVENGLRKEFTHPSIPLDDVSDQLQRIKDACLSEVAGCRVSKDQHYRMYDLAIDFNEDEPKLGFEAAAQIKTVCERFGAVAKISSIHVNTWFGDYDKVSMAKLFLEAVRGEKDLQNHVLFFGDSPNDEPMFAFFRESCGVANIQPFAESLLHLPTYVTAGMGGFGFAEAVDHLLSLR